MLSLSVLCAASDDTREELGRRLSMPALLGLIESTPFNRGCHVAVLHLLASLRLQDDALSCGLVKYLMRLARQAAR